MTEGMIRGYEFGQKLQYDRQDRATQKRVLEEQTRARELENESLELELEIRRRDAEIRGLMGPLATTGSPAPAIAPSGNSDYRDWQVAIDSRRALYPDFNEVVYRSEVEISQYMIQCMTHSAYAADISYYLGKHPDESARISRLPFLDTAAAIKDIEAKVSSPLR